MKTKMMSYRRETEMITSPSKISIPSEQSQVATATKSKSKTNSQLSQTQMTRKKAKVTTKRDAVEPNNRRVQAACLTLYSRLMATMTMMTKMVVQIRGELSMVLMTLMMQSIWTRSLIIQSYMLITKHRCRSNSPINTMRIVRKKRSKLSKDNR